MGSPSLRLRPSPVTITVQTLWSPSQSRAQRENQSRSLTVDRATPSLARSPPSSLPSPSKPPSLPLPNITNASSSSTQSCLPLYPIYPHHTPLLHALIHCFHQILLLPGSRHHPCHRQ